MNYTPNTTITEQNLQLTNSLDYNNSKNNIGSTFSDVNSQIYKEFEKNKDKEIFEKLKGELDVKLGRGWQKYDPVIKKGRPQSYKKLFQELDSDSQESANALIKYFNEGIPEDAPVSPVIHLILILCVCEVGRGYGQAPDNMLAYAHDLIDYPNLTWSSLLDTAGSSPEFAFLCKGDSDEDYKE